MAPDENLDCDCGVADAPDAGGVDERYADPAEAAPPAALTYTGSELSFSTASAAANSVTGRYRDVESRYEVLRDRTLGTGFHASVRECVDRETGERRAVKSIRKQGDRSARAADLHREVELLKEVRHDNVVRLVDVFEDAEHLHLVTELYGGGELFDRIVQRRKSSREGCFGEPEAARVLRQVLSAVSHLHLKGIAHRDIKPENLMFESDDADSRVRLIDLGVARHHYEDSFEEYMSTVVGTAFFISPEVLRERYDKSCDLWSVGVVAYVMLCGYPPFNGRSNKEVCKAVMRGKFDFNSRHWRGVSKEAKDFIRKLLNPNPRKRLTAEQAMRHPWIAKHNAVEKDEEPRGAGGACVEVTSKKQRQKNSVLSFRGSGGRKLRLSMFSR